MHTGIIEQTNLPPVPAELAEHIGRPEIGEALDSIRQGDPLDIFARRLRGTSALGTRAVTMAGLPSASLELLSHAEDFGAQTFLIGGSVVVATGAVVSTVAYGLGRLRQGSRADRADAAQEAVRDTLGEPVDVIRGNGGGMRKSKKLTLRWAGADTAYADGPVRNLPGRFDKVVAFAEEHGIREVVASTRLLTAVKTDISGEYADKQTTTQDLLKAKKGIPISDAKADETLLQLTTAEARQLAERLKAEGMASKTEIIAEWLLQLNSGHPLAAAYKDWLSRGKPDELKPGMIEIIRSGLDRHFNGDRRGNPSIKVRVTDGGTTIAHQKVAVDSDATVGSSGVHSISSGRAISEQGVKHASVSIMSFESIVGGDLDTDFIPDLLEREGEKLGSHETWQLELALYHLLRNEKDEPTAQLRQTDARGASGSGKIPETLYARLINEPPRTFPRTWLPERGKINKEDQTIGYNRLFLRNAGKKGAAMVAAIVVGAGIGGTWGAVWDTYGAAEVLCHPSEHWGLNKPLTSAEQAHCHSLSVKLYDKLGGVAEGVARANDNLENALLLQAYHMGIVDPQNDSWLMKGVNQKWMSEKIADFEQRYNLYGGASSTMGDVHLDPKNPAIWGLSPVNGASTNGYWIENVQDRIFVDSASGDIPPFKQLGITFETSRDAIVPMGTSVPPEAQSQVEAVRELNNLPNAVEAQGRQLIIVNGRQALASKNSNSVLYGLPDGPQTSFQDFSLPVLQGGDIVAANITLNDLTNNKVIKALPSKIYQRTDGTFHLLVSNQIPSNQGYLAIQYTLDPHATNALPVHAERPMEMQRYASTSVPLNTLPTQDVAKIRQEIGVPTNATASQVAAAIANTRSYSYTPYADAKPQKLIAADDSLAIGPILGAIGENAAEMDSADCNVANFTEVLATKGVGGDDNFLNLADGFHNDGDKVLSQSESHQFVVGKNAQIIDATPTSGDVKTPAPTPYEKPSTSHPDITKTVIEGIGILAGSAGSLRLGAEISPLAAEYIRRRRRQQAVDWFTGDNPWLETALEVIGRVQFGSPNTPIDDRTIFTRQDQNTDAPRSAQVRLSGMMSAENLSYKDIQARMQERSSRANITDVISRQTKRDMRRALRRAAVYRRTN